MSDSIGHCPKCDSNELTYGDFVNLEVSYYPFTCDVCGCKGKEYYTTEFLEMSADVDEEREDIERKNDSYETFNEAPYGDDTDDETFNEAPYGDD